MKILVAHPAQQHSYRLAAALEQHGMLHSYLTTVYCKNGSLTKLTSKLLKGSFRTKAESRHTDEVPDQKVVQFCEGEGLLKLLALNKSCFRSFYNPIKYNTADRFARKAARYAIRHNVDAVVTYDDCSPLLFEILSREAPQIRRIMDMSAANLHYMKSIYEKDALLQPAFADRLHRERSILWDEAVMSRALREIKASQYFLVPSSFVEKSLEYSGVRPEQMLRCPYGVDVSEFSCKEYPSGCGRPLRFIYVGGVKELKGISYLLDAFMEIPADQAVLTVVGSFNREDPDIQPYLSRVNFTGSVLHSAISKLLTEADVFVFPSLGDSFALSAMEAASCGLPLILSENTGVSGLMQNNVEGFVIPIQSKDAILDRVNWFITHPEQIRPMGLAARSMALNYTWEKYYTATAHTIRSIMEK